MLNPYVCFTGHDPTEGAVLAFAATAQDARKLAYPFIADWTDCGFIDVRALRLRKHVEYLRTLAEKEGPHVVDDPKGCPVCGLWGNPPSADGNGCDNCDGERAAGEPAKER